MIKCGICHGQTEPNEKPVRVVVETRETTYAMRPDAHEVRRGVYKDDPGGRGVEIVKELLAHKRCVGVKAK